MSFNKQNQNGLRESFSGQKHSQFKRFTDRSMKNTDKIF